eukprot:1833513-Prymnesium_polylepis.1
MRQVLVEERRRQVPDDLDDVLDELVSRRRRHALAARHHDGAGVAGELDASTPLELRQCHRCRGLFGPVSRLPVDLALVASCARGPQK